MATTRFIYVGGDIPEYARLIHESLVKQAEDARQYLAARYLVPYQVEVATAHYKEFPYSEIVRQTLPAFVSQLSRVEWEPLIEEYETLPKSDGGDSKLTVGINFNESMDNACKKIVNYVRNTGTSVPYIAKGKSPNYRQCGTLSIIYMGWLIQGSGSDLKEDGLHLPLN